METMYRGGVNKDIASQQDISVTTLFMINLCFLYDEGRRSKAPMESAGLHQTGQTKVAVMTSSISLGQGQKKPSSLCTNIWAKNSRRTDFDTNSVAHLQI